MNMHYYELYLDNFKCDFPQYLDLFAPSDSRYSNSCISAKYRRTIHQWKAYLLR